MSAGQSRSRSRNWALTWRFARRALPYWRRIVFTFLVVLCFASSKSAQSFLLKPIIDNLQGKTAAEPPEKPASAGKEGGAGFVAGWRALFRPLREWVRGWDLKMVAVVAIILSFMMFGFGYLKDYFTNWLTNRVVADLRNDVVEHLSYLPLRYHYDRKSGDLVSRVTNDVALSESATNFYFDDLFVQTLTILCAMVLVFVTNWQLALGALVLFPLYLLPLHWLARRLRKARKKSLETLGGMTGTMVQTLSGIKVVKAFNMEAAQAEEFRQANESFFRKWMAAIRRKALGENLSQLFLGLGLAVLLVAGGLLLKNRQLEAGDLAVFAMGIAIINSAVREFSKSYNRMVEASAACERVFDILDQSRETEHDAGEEIGKVESVEYAGVSFSYDTVPVLAGISLRARPGEVIAVVGRSGAGKTTLLDLLCRFYDPKEGEVRVNGVDLRRLRRNSLLSQIAVVTQEPFLFHTSIGENIRYGRRDAGPDEVEAAARAANIHDFIAGLPHGYDTLVGDRGAKVSGGQRQRIAIARAVLRNPSILILDEATSALDAESEQAVQAALNTLIRSGTRITFVIAHRLSTVKNADRILVLEGGTVAEEGTHDELLERKGVYASLYRTQFTA